MTTLFGYEVPSVPTTAPTGRRRTDAELFDTPTTPWTLIIGRGLRAVHQ